MNLTCRLLLIVIVLTAGVLQLPALDPDKPMEEYLLDEWGMDKGLPSARVFITVQDQNGYLWFGTQNGLVRYDGVEFETIFLKDTWHPLHRWFSGLAVDRHGVVWFAGAQGVGQYKNGRIKLFPAEEISFVNGAMTLLEDSHGDVWIGGRKHLARFSNGKFTIFDAAAGLAAESIIQLAEDPQGVLWVGSIRGGLYYRQQDEFNRYIIEDFPGNFTPLALYVDQGGTLWIGTNQGLVGIARPLAEKNKGITILTTRDGLCDNNVRCILEDSDGNLWLGTESGLNRVRKEPDGRMTTAKSLAGTSIGSLFEDREKSIWISTYYSGVKRLRDAAVSSFSQREGVPIHPVYLYKDDNKKIWMGSSMGALYRFDDGIFKEEKRLGHSGLLGINALVEDASGDLWLGTRGKGVFHLKGDLKGDRQVHYDFGDIPHSGVVNAGIRDSRDRLWFGTFYGIRCYENGVFRSYTTADGLAANIIMNVYEDSRDNILLGTTAGLDILKKGQLNRENIENYLSQNTIAAIHEDGDGVLWLGTYASGLIRFKDKKAFFFGTGNGLGSNVIFQVIEDGRGKLWMSSINGILSVAKKELNDVAAGLKDKINCTVLGLSDGMLSSECTMSAKYSIVKAGEDEFWFATSRGVSVVKPGKIRLNKTPPPVVIEAALFNGEPVAVVPGVSKEREFKGIQNIRFYFTAPTFISLEKVKIYYKLEGYEREWQVIQPFQERTVFYKDPGPGRYRFRVTAANSDGIRNPEGVSFDFTLKLYFYQALWFKIFGVLLVILSGITLYFGTRRYLYVRKLRNKYKNSTLDPEKAESALKKLGVLLEEDKIFRDETLSLNSLASKLNIAPRYLSQIMNEQLDKSFWALINGYRVEEAKKMLAETGKRDFSIMEIAFEVGFNSKEAFNRAFKKYTGVTPSQFRGNK